MPLSGRYWWYKPCPYRGIVVQNITYINNERID
nr:MAG TPA: hypothetical protein [Caudoviricetes sp.]